MTPAKTTRTRVLTPNQVVAYNLRRAREALGLTQEDAAERLQPFLGGDRWSKATWSAAEASRDPAAGRVRQFDADEIVAFARALAQPVEWFFIPPDQDSSVSSKSAKAAALSVRELLHVAFMPARRESLNDRLRELIPDEDERAEWLRAARVEVGLAFQRSVMVRGGGKLSDHARGLSEEAARLQRLAEDLEALEQDVARNLTDRMFASQQPAETGRERTRARRGRGKR